MSLSSAGLLTIADDLGIGDGKTIGSATTPAAITIASNGLVTISRSDNAENLSLVSTDADASVGPTLRLDRQSSSAADGDLLGKINFVGHNDAGTPEDIAYAGITAIINDASDGTEDGKLAINTIVAGTERSRVFIDASETVFNEDSVDVDFRVESNGVASAFFVDAGADAVVIGESAAHQTISGGTPAFQVSGEGFRGGSAIVRNDNGQFGPFLAFAKSRNTTPGSFTIVQDGDGCGGINFFADDGTNLDSQVATIVAEINGSPGENDTPGRLVFSTTADGAAAVTERMRIPSDGRILFGCTSEPTNSVSGVQLSNAGTFSSCKFSVGNNVGNFTQISFINGNGVVGSIKTNAAATAYNTSSDYRLKENVVTDWDATTRLKQLKPSRFNWKTAKDTTLDGFLAHEVSSIVPEAISGEKDAMKDESNVVLNADGTVCTWGVSKKMWEEGKLPTTDEDGKTVDPIYASDTTWVESKSVPDHQAIDQSKLVPLLTKALQEAISEIETLKTKVTALEGG